MAHYVSHQDLIDFFEAGCKRPSDWRIGTEHEVFLLDKKTKKRLPYAGPQSILHIMDHFIAQGWDPILEKDVITALHNPVLESYISLEPGGQFELSGAPMKTLHDTARETGDYHKILFEALGDQKAEALFSGTDPYNPRSTIPLMPKDRYTLMQQWMPRKGTLGLDMMTRTCTVQVNLDFESEKDMIQKMRIGYALQPLVTALFANSDRLEGKKVPYKSYRAHIWRDTDSERCGFLPFVFEETFGFERYVAYLLSVPMYFVRRNGLYIDMLGQSFDRFIKGDLPRMPGVRPTLKDWADHTTVAFPEVRLKRFIEMRGADCVPMPQLLSLPAFWVGLLYDKDALNACSDMIRSWRVSDMEAAHDAVPLEGLDTHLGGQTLKQVAHTVLQLSRQGLQRRQCLNEAGQDESIYLDPLMLEAH